MLAPVSYGEDEVVSAEMTSRGMLKLVRKGGVNEVSPEDLSPEQVSAYLPKMKQADRDSLASAEGLDPEVKKKVADFKESGSTTSAKNEPQQSAKEPAKAEPEKSEGPGDLATADAAKKGTNPESSGPPGGGDVKFGNQQVPGWEGDPILVQDQIQSAVQRMNVNIANWSERDGVNEGTFHRNGVDPGVAAQGTFPLPTLRDAIVAANLPERGYVYNRVPQADGSTKFNIFVWPADENAQGIKAQVQKMLEGKEQAIRTQLAGTGSSSATGSTNNISNIVTATSGDLRNNPTTLNTAGRDGATGMSSDGKKGEEAKPSAAPTKGNPSDLFNAMEQSFKLGKEVGALAKAGSPGNSGGSAAGYALIDADLSAGVSGFSVPANSAARAAASSGEAHDKVGGAHNALLQAAGNGPILLGQGKLRTGLRAGLLLAMVGVLGFLLFELSRRHPKVARLWNRASQHWFGMVRRMKPARKGSATHPVKTPAGHTGYTVMNRQARHK